MEVFISSSSYLIGCVYNPHTRHSIENFLDAIGPLTVKYSKIIIGGDLNYNILNSGDGIVINFLSTRDSLGLSLVNVTLPTHFQGAPSLLDIFLVSNAEEVIQYQQLSAPVSSRHFLFLGFASSA